MSWLSAALKRNKLDVLNKIAKPVQAVVNPMLDKMPVVGSIKAGAEAVGNFIPTISKDVANAALPAIAQKAGLPSLGTLGGGDSLDPWMKALAAAQLANAGVLGAKSGDYAGRAMGDTQAWWNQREPLRKQGIAGMQAPPTTLPQLGKIAAAGNPFAPKG